MALFPYPLSLLLSLWVATPMVRKGAWPSAPTKTFRQGESLLVLTRGLLAPGMSLLLAA